MITQRPIIANSEILLLGQNPGQRQLTQPAKHPFGLNRKSIVVPWQYKDLYKMGAYWALVIAHEIYKHTRDIPSVANLVTCLTDDNQIKEHHVLQHSEDVRAILEHKDIKLAFCFGNQTFKYFDFYFGKEVKAVKLAHPAYVYRWKSNDEKFQSNQLKIVYNGIMEVYNGETPAESFTRLCEYPE